MNLFISPAYEDKSKELELTARKEGIKIYRAFAALSNTSKTALINEPGIVYGEPAFCEFIAQEMRLNLIQNSPDWIVRIPHTFVKRHITYMTMQDAKSKHSKDNSILGKKVIEPADQPIFNKGVWESKFPAVPNETPIIISQNIDWIARHRFIVLNNKVVSQCCYQILNTFNTQTIWHTRNNMGGMYPEDFLNTLLAHHHTAPGTVIDIGFIKGNGWAVINTIPIWSAEIFGCEPKKFLQALKASIKNF